MRIRGNVVFLVALGAGLSGCHALRGHSCLNDDRTYTRATSIAPLKVPAGLDAPDSKNGLKIPDLNEPAQERGPKEQCLDEPPKYADPKGPKPAPAA